MNRTVRAFEILLIEDSRAEARLIESAWEDCPNVNVKLRHLQQSQDVLPYLRKTPGRPDLILVDYHMPSNGGFALNELKNDLNYLDIPVIVLTGSPSPLDILDCYMRRANCCLVKPVSYLELVELMSSIAAFWFNKAMLPRR